MLVEERPPANAFAGQNPVDLQSNRSWFSPSSWVPRFPPQCWLKTSLQALEQAEKKILAGIWDLMEHRLVPIQNGTKVINTVVMNKQATKTPLVLIHGMGAGVGLWVLNYESLSKNRPLYAFDMLGFGRSSRPKFTKDAEATENEFIESIEEWRKEMNLDKFVLLGHSLGGFLAASYALRHPERVRHLILADPWGFPEKPTEKDGKLAVPWYIRTVAHLLSPFNPLAGLRAMGPWGPTVVSKVRSDIVRKFEHLYTDDTVVQYIYHCNAQPPSGETAFKHISYSFGWALNPMINRVGDIASSVPITMLYGSRSWMDSSMGYQVKYLRHDSYVDVQVIRGAGHHVYADQAANFNSSVRRVCLLVDQQFDMSTQSPIGAYKRLRRASESPAATGSGFSRRRTNSECRPDAAEGLGSLLRPNQTFSGLDKVAILEESTEDTAAEPSKESLNEDERGRLLQLDEEGEEEGEEGVLFTLESSDRDTSTQDEL